MAEAPCGRTDCPIVGPGDIDRRALRVTTLPAGTERFRATKLVHGETTFAPEGVGSGRFSPLVAREHAYVAEQRSAALLESVFHEAAGPNPRIYRAQLARYAMLRVRFADELRLLDVRDPALAALGLERGQLTGADALHYRCTQRVAERLAGTKSAHGLVWTSRQGVMHAARNPDGLASEVLRHQNLDVAVVFRPDYGGRVKVVDQNGLMTHSEPSRFVLELANLLRIAVL